MTTVFKIYLSLIFLFFSGILFAQDDNSVIAKVGADQITVEEYRDRYEFIPHLNYSNDNIDTVKKEFLYSLVAEKLWSLEGSQKRFDTLESVRYSLESLRRLLIRDELYKTKVEPKIKISDEEIDAGLQKVTLELLVKIISTEDSSEIFKISDRLIQGADFDSLLSTRRENRLQETPVRIVFGSFDNEKVEDLLFGMDTGSISLPIKSGNGWFIFKLISKNQNPGVNLSTGQPRNMVMRTLQDRKAGKVGGAYLDSLLGGRRVEADGKIFTEIFQSLYSNLSKKYQANLNDSVFNVTLTEKDIIELLNSLNQTTLNSSFIKFQENPPTAKDFLYYLYYREIKLDNLSPDYVKKILSGTVRQYIEDEMLVREGIKLGLENSRAVVNGVSLWREHYMAQLMMESHYDSAKINDADLKDYIITKDKDSTTAEEKSAFKTELELYRLQKILTEKTIKFANKYSISINENILNEIKLSELNTFTYKLIGFGGRIAAFPETIPLYEWYYIMKNKKTSLP